MRVDSSSMRRMMTPWSTWALSVPNRNSSAKPRMDVSGVRSSWDASARKCRSRCSVASRSANDVSSSPNIEFSARPSWPTSPRPSAGDTRCDRSPALIGVGPGEHKLTYHDLVLDEDTRDVWRAGRLLELTPTEYKLLHYLLSNAHRVLTRDQILEAVWDYTFAGNASVLETYISYLRHKIDDVEPALIHTIRGVGYSLRLPPGPSRRDDQVDPERLLRVRSEHGPCTEHRPEGAARGDPPP